MPSFVSTAKEIVIEPPPSLRGFFNRVVGTEWRSVAHQPVHLHRSLSSLSPPLWAFALCNLKRTIYHLFKVTMALSFSPKLFPLNTHISTHSWSKKLDLLYSTWKLLHPSSLRTPSGGGYSAWSSMCPLCGLGFRKRPV